MSTKGWESFPELQRLIATAGEVIQPIRCQVVVEVREDGEHRRDGAGTPVRCGKPLLGNFGCLEKFQWGGSHGFEGDPRKNMVFRDLTPPRYEGDLELREDGSLTVPRKDGSPAGLEMPEGYEPHPVLDGGVGSGGSRRLKDGDSGRRKLVVVDGEIAGAVLAFLPKKFVFVYEELCDAAYGERRLDASGSMAAPEGGRQKAKKTSGRISSSAVDKTLAAGAGGKSRNTAEIQFKNEQAVDFRRLIDRKLRRIAREIEEFFAGGVENLKAGSRKCSGKCRKIGDPDWLFCARCGGPMEEVN